MLVFSNLRSIVRRQAITPWIVDCVEYVRAEAEVSVEVAERNQKREVVVGGKEAARVEREEPHRTLSHASMFLTRIERKWTASASALSSVYIEGDSPLTLTSLSITHAI